MLKARRVPGARKKEIEAKPLSPVAQVKNAMQQLVVCVSSGEKAVCGASVKHDPQLNGKRRLIEHDCFTVIALHQPVSHDLREIVAATRIAGELERIGNYVSDNASIVTQMAVGS
jgi:phosphate transport system protein